VTADRGADTVEERLLAAVKVVYADYMRCPVQDLPTAAKHTSHSGQKINVAMRSRLRHNPRPFDWEVILCVVS
jgi:hypothetical protein